MTRREAKRRVWAIIAAHLEDGRSALAEDVADVWHEYSEPTQCAVEDVMREAERRAGPTGPGPWGTDAGAYGSAWAPTLPREWGDE